jgi:hypothetical protein
MWCMNETLWCICFGIILLVLIPLGWALVELSSERLRTLRPNVSSPRENAAWLFRLSATLLISGIMIWFFSGVVFELSKVANCSDWIVN